MQERPDVIRGPLAGTATSKGKESAETVAQTYSGIRWLSLRRKAFCISKKPVFLGKRALWRDRLGGNGLEARDFLIFKVIFSSKYRCCAQQMCGCRY
jgi:hypothetical protein